MTTKTCRRVFSTLCDADRYPPTSPKVAAASKRLKRLLQRHLRVTEKEHSATRTAAGDGDYAKLTVHGYHQNAQVLVDTYRCSGSASKVFSLLRTYKRFAAQKAKKDASVVTHLHNVATSRYLHLARFQRDRFLGDGRTWEYHSPSVVQCECWVGEGGPFD